MDVPELLDAAKRSVGTLGEVASRLGVHASRLSEWRKGKFKPDASELALLADMAGLPVLETVAAIEAKIHPEAKAVWLRALGKLRAAGVAASVAMVATALLTAASPDARAATASATAAAEQLCIMSNDS